MFFFRYKQGILTEGEGSVRLTPNFETKVNIFNIKSSEEVNGTDPSPSMRIPCKKYQNKIAFLLLFKKPLCPAMDSFWKKNLSLKFRF
jgi:hypothetical protein